MRLLYFKDKKTNSKIPSENEEIIIFLNMHKVEMRLICKIKSKILHAGTTYEYTSNDIKISTLKKKN